MTDTVTFSEPRTGRSVTVTPEQLERAARGAQGAQAGPDDLEELDEALCAFTDLDEFLEDIKLRHKAAKLRLEIAAKRIGTRHVYGRGFAAVRLDPDRPRQLRLSVTETGD